MSSIIKVGKVQSSTGQDAIEIANSGAINGLKIADGGTIGSASDTDAISISSSGVVTLSSDFVPATPLSHRNMMINGAMLISQRKGGALATNIGAIDNDYRTVDRWRNVWTGGEATRISLQQVSITDLAGFSKAMKIDCVTAEGGTQDADESFRMAYKFEGQDLQGLEKGFSTAKSFTISFWVKGTASRTYVLELKDSDNSRHLTQQFSVTASWVKHTYTIPADTTGKITSDNTEGLELNLWFFAGTNYQGGTYTANTWKTTTTNQRATGISDSGKGLLTTTNDEVYFTGFQMELGSVATPFEHRSYAEEFLKCQRYYQNSYRQDAEVSNGGSARYPSDGPHSEDGKYNTSWSDGNCTGPSFTVAMRTQPSLTLKSFASTTAGKCTVNGTEQTCSVNAWNQQHVSHLVVGGSHATGAFVHAAWEADAEL